MNGTMIRAEDAKFAMNLGFVYRHLPTTQDAHIGFLANRSIFCISNSGSSRRFMGSIALEWCLK